MVSMDLIFDQMRDACEKWARENEHILLKEEYIGDVLLETASNIAHELTKVDWEWYIKDTIENEAVKWFEYESDKLKERTEQ